jgi:hypothetical protein
MSVEVGGSNTGHRCNAVSVDAAVRVGWSFLDGHLAPHVGYAGHWFVAPCQPPPGGDEVTRGVASSHGLRAGLTARIVDGWYVGGEVDIPLWSEFSATWTRTYQDVVPIGAHFWTEYRFFGP